MRYVLDASVGIKAVVPTEVDSARAARVLSDYRAAVHDLIAPSSYVLETAHGLTKAERRGMIPNGEILWIELMLDCPSLYPFQPLMLRAVEISRQFRIGVYDCLYVALAEGEGCEFLIADQRLVNGLGPSFPFITPLASLP